MNKSLLIVASLALGTAAVAQTDPTTTGGTGDPGASQAMQSGSMQTPAEQGSTPSEASQSPSAQTPTGDMSQPGSANTPPSGGDMSQGSGGMQNGMGGQNGAMQGGTGMQSGNGMQGGAMGAQTASTDTSNYPKCGHGVTDKCVQASGGSSMHKTTAHHRMMKHKPQ